MEKRSMARSPKGILNSIWMKVNGASMHARRSENSVPPSASTVVLVHGLSVSSGYMVPTAVRLAPYYHVYLPDLPGFGKSAKPSHILTIPELADALADWMQVMGLPPAVLLGNSLGCQIIVNFALKYPERLTHAVLVGPTMDPQARSIHQAALRLLLDIPCEPLPFLPVLVREYLAAGPRRTIRTLSTLLRIAWKSTFRAYRPRRSLCVALVIPLCDRNGQRKCIGSYQRVNWSSCAALVTL
jgi:2-hydroxy-6-oxonona-2,4-dienedioate hydrolase